jgi:hypothetical protein
MSNELARLSEIHSMVYGEPSAVSGNLSDLSNLSSLTNDLASMANSIDEMGVSITVLTDFAKRKAEELMELVPSKPILIPIAAVGTLLFCGFFATGIIANVKNITSKK